MNHQNRAAYQLAPIKLLILLCGLSSNFVTAQDINFGELKRQGPPVVKQYTVPNTKADGERFVLQFESRDSDRIAVINSLRSSGSSQGSSSHSSTSSGSSSGSNSSSVQSMQQRSYDNAGRKTVGYDVRCSNGTKETIYRSAWDSGGPWYYGSYPLSQRFLAKGNVTAEDAAQILCR